MTGFFLSDRKRLKALGLIATHSSPALAGVDPLCRSLLHVHQKENLIGRAVPLPSQLRKAQHVMAMPPRCTRFPIS